MEPAERASLVYVAYAHPHALQRAREREKTFLFFHASETRQYIKSHQENIDTEYHFMNSTRTKDFFSYPVALNNLENIFKHFKYHLNECLYYLNIFQVFFF